MVWFIHFFIEIAHHKLLTDEEAASLLLYFLVFSYKHKFCSSRFLLFLSCRRLFVGIGHSREHKMENKQ